MLPNNIYNIFVTRPVYNTVFISLRMIKNTLHHYYCLLNAGFFTTLPYWLARLRGLLRQLAYRG